MPAQALFARDALFERLDERRMGEMPVDHTGCRAYTEYSYPPGRFGGRARGRLKRAASAFFGIPSLTANFDNEHLYRRLQSVLRRTAQNSLPLAQSRNALPAPVAKKHD